MKNNYILLCIKKLVFYTEEVGCDKILQLSYHNTMIMVGINFKTDKTNLTTRILKLQPHPKYFYVGIQDWDMLKNHFSNLFETDSGVEVFGNSKKEDLTTFMNIINTNV